MRLKGISEIFLENLYFIIFIIFLCVYLSPQISWPIWGEEVDYVRFSFFPPAGHFFSEGFFNKADGHPPLLSLIFSYFLSSFSHVEARLFSLSICASGVYFIFAWMKQLKAPGWVGLLLSISIVITPTHRELLTAMFGDFHGFVMLMGWAFFRHTEKPKRAFFFLFLACLIRETHFIPAALYLVMFWKEPSVKRNRYVELVPILFLILYYVSSKFYVGEWYSFSGVNDIEISKLLKMHWIKTTLQLLIPLTFLVILQKTYPPRVEIPLFFRIRFLVCLTAILLISLSPYIAAHFKPRLFTPFISFYWLSFIFSWNQASLKPGFKNYLLVVALCSTVLVHNKFVYIKSKAPYIAESKFLVKFMSALELPLISYAYSGWPHGYNLTIPALGYVKKNNYLLNDKFLFSQKENYLEDYPDAPFIFVTIEEREDTAFYLKRICRPSCNFMPIVTPSNSVWNVYYRNIPDNRVIEAGKKLQNGL